MTSESAVARYGLAGAFFAAAVVANMAIGNIMGAEHASLAAFYPAVLLAAHRSGLRPSVLVLALACCAPWLLWTAAPVNERLVATALLLAIGGFNVVLIEHLRRAHSDLRAHDARLILVNNELRHRIKNLFAITSAVCVSTIRSGLPPDEAARVVAGRIQTIAEAQSQLGGETGSGAAVGELVETLVAPLCPSPDRLVVKGCPARLPIEQSTPFALTLHELATNALKHGAWATGAGWVEVCWSIDSAVPTRLCFKWEERDGPPPPLKIREGLGMRLIKQGIPDATVEYTFGPNGLRWMIDIASVR